MTRMMGDGTNALGIPQTVQLAAGYWNGSYTWTTVEWSRFPADRYGLVRIDVTGQHADTADVLDVENGDASPFTANLWVQSWHKLGRKGLPVIYVNRSNMQAVTGACKSGGSVLGTHYGLWVATLDGTKVAGPGIVACQFAGHGSWDESVVYNDAIWLPVRPAPPVPAPTKAQALAALETLTDYIG
jgi:hypothetical protein